jgi:outer membrane protein OmpA-like peptidoglycan-associated protein
MKRKGILGTLAIAACALPAICQKPDQNSGPAPIYRVTVIQRSVNAINYQYRTGPTKIDFRGTVLLPQGKGEATVESSRGRTEIDAKFEKLEPAQRFGREYLTYVLWAITPEGRPRSIGEIVPGGSNKARLRVTTDLQAFGLIVTAEPYSAVRLPSDVVVLENDVRPDTVGKIEGIQARYELMPRGQYTWQPSANPDSQNANAPKVSMDEYEQVSQIYQAQNAIAIASAAGAQQYASSTLAKAQQLLSEARRLREIKSGTSLVVQNAREAAQTAEDARVIAERRQQEEKLAVAQSEANKAQQAKTQAEADASRARNEVEAEREARQHAEAEAEAARQRAAQAEAEANRPRTSVPSSRQPQDQAAAQKTGLRKQLLEQLNGVLVTRDTPRGLVATLSDVNFNGPALQANASNQVARLAAIVAAHPGLRVEVDGNTDSAGTEGMSFRRAEAVRSVLVTSGLPASAVATRGLGATRPMTSNANAAGRQENRRVEIVISGDLIGSLPYWDRSYTLTTR